MSKPTPFQRVAAMNIAFGNPAVSFQDAMGNRSLGRVRKQCANILHEYVELQVALGADKTRVTLALEAFESMMKGGPNEATYSGEVNMKQVRDSLCDINVFSYGAMHMLGVNGDQDMHSVVDGVMTRFIRDDADKGATVTKHAANGITQVYFEGEYPTMIMKSLVDQPDAPEGKFLKSASYREPMFTANPEAVHLSPVPLIESRYQTVYIAGPMTGKPHHNFPAFNAMADLMREAGWTVVNPADHGMIDGASYRDYLRFDVGNLSQCDHIVLLPGWEDSFGAKLEATVAHHLGIDFSFAQGANQDVDGVLYLHHTNRYQHQEE